MDSITPSLSLSHPPVISINAIPSSSSSSSTTEPTLNSTPISLLSPTLPLPLPPSSSQEIPPTVTAKEVEGDARESTVKSKGSIVILEFLLSSGKRYRFPSLRSSSPPSPFSSSTSSTIPVETKVGEEVEGKEGYFGIENNAKEVKEIVWNSWPVEWTEGGDEKPDDATALRILYLGKFLDDSVRLGDVGIQPGSTTIFHLLIRKVVPSVLSDTDLIKPHKTSSCCLIS